MSDRLHSNHEKKEKSRDLNNAFNMGGISLLVKCSKSPNKKLCMNKIILPLPEYYQKYILYAFTFLKQESDFHTTQLITTKTSKYVENSIQYHKNVRNFNFISYNIFMKFL